MGGGKGCCMCFTCRIKPCTLSVGKNQAQTNVSFALIAESSQYLHFLHAWDSISLNKVPLNMKNGSSVQAGSFQSSVVTQIAFSPQYLRRILGSRSQENEQVSKQTKITTDENAAFMVFYPRCFTTTWESWSTGKDTEVARREQSAAKSKSWAKISRKLGL